MYLGFVLFFLLIRSTAFSMIPLLGLIYLVYVTILYYSDQSIEKAHANCCGACVNFRILDQ